MDTYHKFEWFSLRNLYQNDGGLCLDETEISISCSNCKYLFIDEKLQIKGKYNY